MSRLRANKITNQAADGAPTVENGLIISGVTTVTTLDLNGDLDVDGHLNADNVSITGVVTATTVSATTVSATSFNGDGSNLSGLASREVYGFTGIGKSLSLTTTNSGADNIDNTTYTAFEESFIGPSGLSFSINTSGNLIMTV